METSPIARAWGLQDDTHEGERGREGGREGEKGRVSNHAPMQGGKAQASNAKVDALPLKQPYASLLNQSAWVCHVIGPLLSPPS